MIRRLIILLLIVGCEETVEPTSSHHRLEEVVLEDCAGVAGGTAIVDCSGVCGGSAGVFGCDGVCGSFAIADSCGGCIDGTCTPGCTGGSTGIEPSYQDCFGSWCGTAIEDCEGVCNGDAGVFDCSGVCGGNAIIDCSGVCGGSGGVFGCDGVCDSQKEFDGCGVCDGSNSCFTAIGIATLASNNMTVTLNELTVTEKTGSYEYYISYTLTNNTTDQEIDEGSFKMYYQNESGGKPQYGGFNSLFPDDTINRTYTFEELKSKPFGKLSYHHDHFFSDEPPSDALIWQVTLP